jgi:hypothetical protein
MTRDEILAADEAVLRRAIRDRTGEALAGRRSLEGLRRLAAQAFNVDLAPSPASALSGEGGLTQVAELPERMIELRILRDYWPRGGERLRAGTETRLPEDEAKPLVRAGTVEWI